MRVRKDVWKLPAGDTTLEWYGKAVAAMRTLPKSNPLSWEYQGAIHGIGTIPNAMTGFWAECQHGSSFFLPWHRMYLLHFERIVAANVAKLGGPADWALPYWDYSTNKAYRVLPTAFQSPTLANGTPNPLYVAARNPKANAGTAVLGDKDVDLKKTLKAAGTTAPAGFFGAPPKAHFGSGPGQLELTPHNAVHRQLGFGGGWMADPDLAALDPIFWLHHANIDRLWEVWLGRDPTNKNLAQAYWLTGVSFKFHNAKGAVVAMTASDVVDLKATALQYSYEDTSDPLAKPGGLVPTGPTMSTSAPNELVGATTAPIKLGDQVTHVDMPTPVSPQSFKTGGNPNALVPPGPPSQFVQQVTLQLEQVTSSAIAPTYDVYLNVPAGGDPAQHEDRFVGRAAMFGIAQASALTAQHAGGGQNFAFDITDLYHRLADGGDVDFQNLRVSFVPVDPEGTPQVSVGRISLYFA